MGNSEASGVINAEVSPQQLGENLTSKEIQTERKVKVFFTDHSPDRPETSTAEHLRGTYQTAREMGADYIRTDIRMDLVNPKQGEFDQESMARYLEAFKIMSETGLEPPSIVLSSFPEWMKTLYKTDRNQFFESWEKYNQFVADNLEKLPGGKVSRLQVLNEPNHFSYDQVTVADLGHLCDIARSVFKEYNPDLKIRVTVSMLDMLDTLSKFGKGKGLMDYLETLKSIKGSFDVVGLDPYPGTWHKPISTRFDRRSVDQLTDDLEVAVKEIATWGKEWEISETGFPGGGKRQLEFYRTFPLALRSMFGKLAKEGVEIPDDLNIGFYAINDEPSAKRLWEKSWGIVDSQNNPKPVAQKGFINEDKIINAGREVPEIDQPPRLRKIIDELRRESLQAITLGREEYERKQDRQESSNNVKI